MNKENDNDITSWIFQNINPSVSENVVKNVIPEKFETYFKLYFPIIFENEETGQSRKITYLEIAKLGGLTFEKNFSTKSFPDYISPFITASDKDEYEMLENLQTVLEEDQPIIFYGLGGENLPEKFTNPWASIGPINSLTNIVKAMNEFAKMEIVNFPSYIFPKDQSWLIGNIILQSGVLVLGCGEDLAKKIRTQSDIEFIELEASDEYFDFGV
ncbi:MAG: hypothetical protein AB8H03_00650 [Saprospiraceae bacterium]